MLYARQRLKRLSQKKGESVQNFFQRIHSLAEESYPGQDIRQPVLQEQLMEIFVDGLAESSMARRLLRVRPETLDHALRLATQEQSANRTFQLRRGEEEMEVDEIRRGNSYPADQVVSQVVENVSDMMAYQQDAINWQLDGVVTAVEDRVSCLVAQVGTQPAPHPATARGSQDRPINPRFPSTHYYQGASSEPGNSPKAVGPKCFKCKLYGHYSKDCRSQQPGRYVSDGTTRPFCTHCQKDGHHEGNCWIKKRQAWKSSVNQVATSPSTAHAQRPVSSTMRQTTTRGGNQTGQANTRPRFQWTDDGRPICAGYGVVGHKRFECRKTAKNQHLNATAAVSRGPRKQ